MSTVTTRPDTVGADRLIGVGAVATTFATSAAPTTGTTGTNTGVFARVRTLITYTGAVTSCRLRLWIRQPGTTVWFKGASTDDASALAPGGAASSESRDWDVGRAIDVYFQVETINPGTTGNTVAVDVHGVEV